MRRVSKATFRRMIWEMLNRPMHFVMFQEVYKDALDKLYSKREQVKRKKQFTT